MEQNATGQSHFTTLLYHSCCTTTGPKVFHLMLHIERARDQPWTRQNATGQSHFTISCITTRPQSCLDIEPAREINPGPDKTLGQSQQRWMTSSGTHGTLAVYISRLLELVLERSQTRQRVMQLFLHGPLEHRGLIGASEPRRRRSSIIAPPKTTTSF